MCAVSAGNRESMNVPDTYTLYGSYASYYTAKVRFYLRKKGIPFVERLPSDPEFRSVVRPASGTHRIPQLSTPEGVVIQDSVAIVDYLESKFPEPTAFPISPKQRTYVHLMELFGSDGLLRLAWLHRWVFSENNDFVKMDFGRSFKPQGSDEELLKYGSLISDRMRSYGLPESTQRFRDLLDDTYQQLLKRFEAHLIDHPYLLGGQPCAADYAVMGAMHAHLGRDPAGLRMMQNHAPRTFRWVEHMIVPEIVSPEFFDRQIEFVSGDDVPQSALSILQLIADMRLESERPSVGEGFVRDALSFNQAMARIDAQPGHELAPDQDQPFLSRETLERDGADVKHSANLYALWVAQRAQRHFQTQSTSVQADIVDTLGSGCVVELLQVPVTHPIERVNNRLVLANE